MRQRRRTLGVSLISPRILQVQRIESFSVNGALPAATLARRKPMAELGIRPIPRSSQTFQKDLVKLPPGQTLQAQQDITTHYRFAPGTNAYTATYAAVIQQGSPRKYATVSSQPVTFTFIK